MGFTGGGFTFIVCLSFMVAVYDAAHIKTEEHFFRRLGKRETVEFQNGILVVNPTKEVTHVKIVTDNGDILFHVDSSITDMGSLNSLLAYTSMLFFPEPGRTVPGNSSDFIITKSPSETGVKVVIADKDKTKLFYKELKGEQKGVSTERVHLTGFKVVVDPSLDVNHRDGYKTVPLVWAALLGDKEAAKSLVEKGADVNSQGSYGYNPLIGAISSGDEELVEFLIKKGAKVNQPIQLSAFLPYPLHFAAFKGRVGVARILLKHGANLSPENRDGSTPLHIAASEGQFDMVKELVARGADVRTPIKDKHMTPVHMAALIGDVNLTNFLLQSGADVNSKTTENNTPLMLAIWFHYNEQTEPLNIVKELVGHYNADVNVKNDKGQSALSLASSRGYSKVQEYLKAHGAV